MNKKVIKVLDIVGGPSAVEPTKAKEINREILEEINSGNQVVLDFAGITSVLTLFLNPAIGDLYGELEPETIKKFFSVENVNDEFKDVFKLVINRAKRFYKNKDILTNAIAEEFDNE
ncbi:MAG: STAS-like domain-containing protein [Clostridia bacterium]